MDHSVYALRVGVRTHLLAQNALTDLITGVYETAPARAVYPYLTFGNDRLRDWSTQTFTGMEHQLLLNTWSNSHDFGELHQIHHLVRQHLSDFSVDIEGHKLVAFFAEEERFLVDRRRKKRLGVLRYKALTQPLESAAT